MTDEQVKKEMQELEKHQDAVWAKFPDVYFPCPVVEPLKVASTGENVPGRFAIVDDFKDPGDDGRIFNICSEMYGLRLHETVVYKIMDVCEGIQKDFGKPSYNLTMVAEGARMKFEVTFPDVRYEIRKGDVVWPRIYTLNSYDLGWKLTHRAGIWREICSNGAIIGEIWQTFKKRHIASLDLELLIDDLRESFEKFRIDTIEWKRWTERKVSEKEYELFWERFINGKPPVFNKTERPKVEALPERGTSQRLADFLRKDELTLWDLHNVVTQYITHEFTSEIRRTEVEPVVGRIFEQYAKAA
jgi:hypothetical protein